MMGCRSRRREGCRKTAPLSFSISLSGCDGSVTLEARGGNVAGIDGGVDRATRFAAVTAIGEAALSEVRLKLDEAIGDLGPGEVAQLEFADSGAVDDKPVGEVMQASARRRLASASARRDLADRRRTAECAKERALADARLPDQQRLGAAQLPP